MNLEAPATACFFVQFSLRPVSQVGISDWCQCALAASISALQNDRFSIQMLGSQETYINVYNRSVWTINL